MSGPVLIEAALNGVVSRRSPHVPITADEVVDDAIACFDAGATIVHVHAPADAPDAGLGFYQEVFERVGDARPGACCYPGLPSAGSAAERLAHMIELARRGLLRVAAFDPGSTNLGVRLADGRPAPSPGVYANSHQYVTEALQLCRQHRLAPTTAIFEPTFLHTVLAHHDAGAMPAGWWLKFYFGGAGGYPGVGAGPGSMLPFGLPPTRTALSSYLEIVGDRQLTWGVAAMGADVFASGLARAALELGGHLHVGLESYVGEGHPTNVELVTRSVALCAEVGRGPMPWQDGPVLLGFPASVSARG